MKMHRTIKLTTNQTDAMRWMGTAAYLSWATAGLLLTYSVEFRTLYQPEATIISVFLFVGGAASAAGTICGNWMGEFIGLPLLSTSFVSLGTLFWIYSHDETPYIAAANFLILAGFSVYCVARFIQVLSVYQMIKANEMRANDGVD
jgi:hypothetical protein